LSSTGNGPNPVHPNREHTRRAVFQVYDDLVCRLII
jgi:Malic enzyme, N-terminal domain